VYKNEKGYTVVAGNFTDQACSLNIRFGEKYLNIQTAPHSFNTYLVP
jgi:hypothetical protein